MLLILGPHFQEQQHWNLQLARDKTGPKDTCRLKVGVGETSIMQIEVKRKLEAGVVLDKIDLFFKKILFIYLTERERERERENTSRRRHKGRGASRFHARWSLTWD